MGLGLPGIASVKKQCSLSMVFDGFFQLTGSLAMKELWGDLGLLGSIC